jgi:Leucine-rich repeat (LRR) protein
MTSLGSLGDLAELRSLDLSASQLVWNNTKKYESLKTFLDVKQLTELPQLQNLRLVETKIFANGAERFGRRGFLKSLREEELVEWDAMLEQGLSETDALARFLQRLSIDLSQLAEVKKLESLVLDDAQVSSLESLPTLKALRSLSLNRTAVRDISPLTQQLPNLDTLVLRNTNIHDLSQLVGMERLQTLAISDTKVDDLTPLTKLPSLSFVDLAFTPLSISEVERLQRQMPELRINF